ncbi:hypothetical protein QE152_g32628 [Popillia japonica]|uniref:Uncharacterized protein n=1 Tax=Popillia japonica TaxID=7064 RepID=A0AAW1IYS8_POPJA
MVTAVNTYASPVLMYSFGIIDWTATELDDINRLVRVTFTKHKAHHPRGADYYQQLHDLRDFFQAKSQTSNIHRAVNDTDDRITPLNLKDQHVNFKEKIVE